MKKAEMLAALAGVDPDVLWGKTKNKEITKLFLQGVPNKEIAAKYGLSISRISQIVARQARRALLFKNLKNDLEYQVLVEQYVKKLLNDQPIIIHSSWENHSKHLLAVSAARQRIKVGEEPVKSYIIKIELTGTDPLIWRRVIMPAGATFNRLHDVIQNITNFQSGWPNSVYHLYEFDLKEIRVTNDEEAYQTHLHFKQNRKIYKERLKTMQSDMVRHEEAYQERLEVIIRKPTGLKIDHYLEKYREIRYIYDFGENWQLTVRLEAIVDDYYFGYPTLLDGAGTAPPEDVGGLPGFYEFWQVYNDKNHPEHEVTVARAKELYFREYDPEWINRRLKDIKYKSTAWDKINHDNYKIIDDNYRKE